VQAAPPQQVKVLDAECWVIKSIVAEIAIQVCHELEARSEHSIWNHPDLVYVLAEGPDNNWDVEWLANGSCHSDVGEA